jgi:hypothetical protein
MPLLSLNNDGIRPEHGGGDVTGIVTGEASSAPEPVHPSGH